MAYADDVNLKGDDIITMERNADVLLNTCKDIGLAVSTRINTQNEVRHFSNIEVCIIISAQSMDVDCHLKKQNLF